MSVFSKSTIQNIAFAFRKLYLYTNFVIPNNMNDKLTIECFGMLTKEEPICCIDNALLLKDHCVLESVSPFIGYYAHDPYVAKPTHLYLIIDKKYNLFDVLGFIQKVRDNFYHNLDAVPTSLIIEGQKQLSAIRVKSLQQYGQIMLLQHYFVESGLEFCKFPQRINTTDAVIKIEKLFHLEGVGEGIYFDMDQSNHGYFDLPFHVEWNEFKDITKAIKYDLSLPAFDAATVVLLRKNSLTDLVRVYSEKMHEHLLSQIKEKYDRALTKQ